MLKHLHAGGLGRTHRREGNPSAERPTLRRKSPSTCFGGTSVAQPTGTCRHAKHLTFLTACIEPACTWGLTFRVVPFVTWSACPECRVPRRYVVCLKMPPRCLSSGPQVWGSVRHSCAQSTCLTYPSPPSASRRRRGDHVHFHRLCCPWPSHVSVSRVCLCLRFHTLADIVLLAWLSGRYM